MRNTFLILFVCLVFFSGIFAGTQLWRGQLPAMSWLGLLLASAAPLVFFGLRYFLARRGQELHPIVFSCISGLGVAVSMTASWKYGDSAGQIHIWSGVCLLAWIVYLRQSS